VEYYKVDGMEDNKCWQIGEEAYVTVDGCDGLRRRNSLVTRWLATITGTVSHSSYDAHDHNYFTPQAWWNSIWAGGRGGKATGFGPNSQYNSVHHSQYDDHAHNDPDRLETREERGSIGEKGEYGREDERGPVYRNDYQTHRG
jgi:hypothetical protein